MEQRGNEKKRLALLCGGQCTEHEVSLRSSIQVLKAIDRTEFDVILICVDKEGRWMLSDEDNYLVNPDDALRISLITNKHYIAVVPGRQDAPFIDTLTGQSLPRIDVVYTLLNGGVGEDGSVQGVLRVLNIPFIGCDVLASAVCMDKEMTKRVLREAGISVAPWVTLLRSADSPPDYDAITAKLGTTLFVKPASNGSSVGVSKVHDRADFDKAVELAFVYDHKVLVETAIVGREIETAVIGNNKPEVSVSGEILPKDKLYTYENKYISGNLAGIVIPAHLDSDVSEQIRRIARDTFLAIGCAGMARVDCFLTQEGKIIINEVNNLPGFTPNSLFPMLWESSGLSRSEQVKKVINLALERARQTEGIKTDIF